MHDDGDHLSTNLAQLDCFALASSRGQLRRRTARSLVRLAPFSCGRRAGDEGGCVRKSENQRIENGHPFRQATRCTEFALWHLNLHPLLSQLIDATGQGPLRAEGVIPAYFVPSLPKTRGRHDRVGTHGRLGANRLRYSPKPTHLSRSPTSCAGGLGGDGGLGELAKARRFRRVPLACRQCESPQRRAYRSTCKRPEE